MEYRIGDFSLATRLSVKTLRYYDEMGILAPSRVDAGTGYRLYDEAALERARTVIKLRELDFGIAEIRELLGAANDDQDLVGALRRKAAELDDKIERFGRLRSEIERALAASSIDSPVTVNSEEQPAFCEVPRFLVASLRFKGRYEGVGSRFALLYKLFGRYAAGPPLMLYHDTEYLEDGADLEACLPLKASRRAAEGVRIVELPAIKALRLTHRGSYATIGNAYGRAFKALGDRGLSAQPPSREIYLKGPGMILRGDPTKYVTRLEFPIGIDSPSSHRSAGDSR
jgi:DNA-binding transcriptional MerR regulator